MRALGMGWSAFWRSRLLVFGTGIVAAAVGTDPGPAPRAELAEPFGTLGDVLVAPAARFDAVWYVSIADEGYSEAGVRSFFPVYPALMRLGSVVTGSALVAGILISLVAFLVALHFLYRLTELELGDRVAERAVLLAAFAPLSFFFSAVYTEALFLALSVGAFYAARTGRWAWAGVLGGLAAGTRSAGVLLLIPLAILYVQGHRVRPDVLWLAAVPAGLLAFALYLGVVEGDALGMFDGQERVGREWAFPLVGLAEGIGQGVEDAVAAVREDGVGFSHNVHQLPWIAFAAIATIGVFRRLPVAYGAWVAVSVALPLSVPMQDAPLLSFGRFMLVVFPFWIWLAAWSVDRRWGRIVPVLSGALLVYYTWQFTNWIFSG